MARLFTGSSAVYAEHNVAVVTAAPLTISAWFYPANVTAYFNMVCLSQGGGDYFVLVADGSAAGDPVKAIMSAGASETVATSTTGFVANAWHHGCAVFTSTSSRSAYINGGSKNTNAVSSGTPNLAGTSRTTVGAFNDGSARFGPMNGRLAEVAIWNAALTDAEVAALAGGVSPNRVRPANLLPCWRLLGLDSPERSWTATPYSLTLTGSPALANHAPVTPFSRRLWSSMPVIEEAGGGGAAVVARRSRMPMRLGSRGPG